MSVQDHINDAMLWRRKVTEAEKSASIARGMVEKTIAELQEKIRAGETTGDRLRDLIFLADGSEGLDEAHVATYQALERRLFGKKGEFVLIGYDALVRRRFGGQTLESDFEREEHFRIGLLADDKLGLFEDPSYTILTLPIDKFLLGQWPQSFMYKVVAEDTVYKKDFFEWTSVEEQPPRLWDYLTNENLEKNLYIGDEAVKAALKSVECESFFAEAAGRLGRLVLQPTP
jgi:hypothetical protein